VAWSTGFFVLPIPTSCAPPERIPLKTPLVGALKKTTRFDSNAPRSKGFRGPWRFRLKGWAGHYFKKLVITQFKNQLEVPARVSAHSQRSLGPLPATKFSIRGPMFLYEAYGPVPAFFFSHPIQAAGTEWRGCRTDLTFQERAC